MRARVILLITAVAVLTGTALVTSRTVDAIVPASGITFESPTRILDSRTLPNGVVENRPIGVEPGKRMIVSMVLADASAPSWAYLHPCGSPIDRTMPAANYAEPGFDQRNLVPIDPGECVTMIGTATLGIDMVARQSPGGDLSYVAFDNQVEIELALPASGVTRAATNARVKGVPPDATHVAIWVTVEASGTAPTVVYHDSCISVWTPSESQSVIAAPDEWGDNLILAELDDEGNVCFARTGGETVSASANIYGYLSPTATPTAEGLPYSGFVEREMPGFEAVSPVRLFDTRDAGAPIPNGGTHRYQVTGLPAGATAVALNITATQTSAPGFASAYPCDAPALPEVSNVNWTGPGATVPNFSIVSLGDTGELCFFALSSTHLIADLAGYFIDGGGSGFVPLAPDRLFDTRTGGGPVPAGTVHEFDLDGYVPAGSTAAVLNVTVTEPIAPGFVSAFPCGQAPPDSSNVNYVAGETRPNVATVKVPGDGRVCFFTSTQTHLIADLAGAFAPTSDVGFVAVEPFRTLDTRIDLGGVPFLPNEELGVTFPSPYLEALAWNLTVTATEGAGFVAGYPCAGGLPPVSNVNFSGAGQTLANFAFLTPDDAGDLCFFALTGTHLIADEAGYFVSPVPWEVYYDGAPPANG